MERQKRSILVYAHLRNVRKN